MKCSYYVPTCIPTYSKLHVYTYVNQPHAHMKAMGNNFTEVPVCFCLQDQDDKHMCNKYNFTEVPVCFCLQDQDDKHMCNKYNFTEVPVCFCLQDQHDKHMCNNYS